MHPAQVLSIWDWCSAENVCKDTDLLCSNVCLVVCWTLVAEDLQDNSVRSKLGLRPKQGQQACSKGFTKSARQQITQEDIV